MKTPNTGVWRLATRLVPVSVQVVLAAAAGVMWLLDKGPLDGHDAFGALMLTGATITAALALLLGWNLLRSKESARAHAFGLSIAGAGAAVLIGAAAYALWLLPWLLKPGS